MRHNELLVSTEAELIHSSDSRHDGGQDAVVSTHSYIEDLETVITKYGADRINLTTSEDKQWISVTGFPKNNNPVSASAQRFR